MFWILEALTFLFLTHIFRNLIVRWGWLAFNMARLIPRIILAVSILGQVVYFARIVISLPLDAYNPQAWKLTEIAGHTMVYGLIFFLWSVLYFIYHYFERYNLSLQHEAALNEIELSNLKSQLNPHFIFNALNSIRALVDENPGKSKNAITQLSNILRNSLISDKKRLTNFGDEFKTVKDYLSLESIRFEERLKMEFDIHPDSYKFLVPPLMLQTLVENGIKHGISKLKEGGFIKLRTFVTDSQLKIQIRNSGHFKAVNGTKAEGKGGLGLRNTRQRLKLLYREEAYLKIFNETKNTVLTELVIPQNN
ncbi:Autolysin sensor kinase [Fulvivirga imtechensis AK7]|uniref:Autolysin sensor kinase n=2 Tax=Fulvivirga TaxID=396811 RepID=L8JNX3_9BACT|nr:Autolysin sensor kinase [Fulvivirga imtechensis AK7]